MQFIKFFKNDKWGFRDENLNIVCEAKYDWIEDFHQGFTKVKTNVNWFNNISVIKLDRQDNLFAGLILIKEDEKNYFMYSFENVISDVKIEEHKNIKVFFKDEDHFALNYNSENFNEGISHLINGFAKASLHNKIYFIDSKGKEFLPTKIDFD